ncbi:hypothetical protein [Dyella subtropica]|uniref:hypothetical protein n=1 Tax=Dyella subtropica TaxID=2992127 RepID=UPI00224D2B1C|nr:hypothetical protein [Dyella subtropica]
MSNTEQGLGGGKKIDVSAANVNASTEYEQFKPIQFVVSGTQEGCEIAVNLTDLGQGYPVEFSLGGQSGYSAGLHLSMTSPGTLPLADVMVVPNQLTFQTGSSGHGKPWSFLFNCFLAGEAGVQQFALSCFADPSVTVLMEFEGQKSYTLSNVPTIFSWN